MDTNGLNPFKGLQEYSYTFELPLGGQADLECWFSYEGAEEGSTERGTGLKMEPDTEESYQLEHALVGGVDILWLLSDETIQEITEHCMLYYSHLEDEYSGSEYEHDE